MCSSSSSHALRQTFGELRASGFFRRTPLRRGPLPNSWLKLDQLQSTGSFKDRGISHMMRGACADRHVSQVVCSSGGNAGLAVAHAGRLLGKSVRVFLPATTMPMIVDRLGGAGARVLVGGGNWNEADAEARTALDADPSALYVPPFDHPLIWEGHSSIVDELAEAGEPPDAVVVGVGGGGLLRGVQLGAERLGWTDLQVFAVETEGTASFAAAKREGRAVRLACVSGLATSLGALSVTPSVLDSRVATASLVVSDRSAVLACHSFARDYRALVEPACGAALSVLYSQEHRELLRSYKRVVVVVCGGSAVSRELLDSWMRDHP